MAPFVPFVTDYIWNVLRRPGDAESVHLASWPSAGASLIDPGLSEQMGLVRRLVELGRSARAGASVRTRQPLSRALIGAAGFASLPEELRAEIAAELNVSQLEPLDGELVDYSVKPNFRALGRRFGAQTPAVAAAVASAPAAEVAPVVLAGGSYAVRVDGFSEPLPLAADDVIVTQTPRAGWAVATGGGETVAIDTTVSAELQREGLAREFVRLVADARKNDGLDVTDRIWLRWSADDPEMAAALTEHAGFISGEVLAVDFGPVGGGGLDLGAAGALAEAAREHVEDGYGLRFWLGRA